MKVFLISYKIITGHCGTFANKARGFNKKIFFDPMHYGAFHPITILTYNRQNFGKNVSILSNLEGCSYYSRAFFIGADTVND